MFTAFPAAHQSTQTIAKYQFVLEKWKSEMLRHIVNVIITFLVAVGAFVLVVADHVTGWSRRPIAPHGDTAAFVDAVTQRIRTEAKGNAVFVLLEDGRIAGDFASSVGEPVDGDTRFQVASLSKWVTAFGVMTLVDAGVLDLDAPVSMYLTRWSLPPSAFNNDGVTIRRLLSHTAGLGDQLGYGGFGPDEDVQTLEDSLIRARDASPGKSGVASVVSEPGSEFEYSGGSYALLQLVIEEVSGRDFNEYMREAVLAPLGMVNSTFILERDASNLAEFYNRDGGLATHYRFSAPAAASLYTTANDMTRFIQAHLPSPDGAVAGRGTLAPETLQVMRTPHAFELGAPIWGLGVMLYAPNGAGGHTIGHDGANEPAINTSARVNPDTGDGVVVLETGNERLASSIAGDWVYWSTKQVDFVTATIAFPAAILRAVLAAIVSAGVWLTLSWRVARRRRRP